MGPIRINIGLGHLAWDMIWACGPMGPSPGPRGAGALAAEPFVLCVRFLTRGGGVSGAIA